MSKNVLAVLLLIAVLGAVVYFNYLSPAISTVPERAKRPSLLDQALKPNPGADASGQSAAAVGPAPVPSALSSVRADDTAQAPHPEPPRVGAITGNWGRNPFLTLEEIDFLRNPHKYDVEPEPQAVRLSTIITVNGKRTAALSGHYVSVGDYLGTEKVVGISEYSLTLQRENGKTREIKLHELVVQLKSGSRR